MNYHRVLVTGAGGFIGHHLATFLKQHGYWVRSVDLKRPEYRPSNAAKISSSEGELMPAYVNDVALRS